MSGHSLLAYARRAAGLTQDALARLAGTSQPTLSAYERGTKSPSLAVAERIIEAAGQGLEVMPNLEFVEVPGQHGLHLFWLANPAVAAGCGMRVQYGPASRTSPRLAGAAAALLPPDRTDRARAYELILRQGSPSDLLDYIDGALLVDIWRSSTCPTRSAAPGSRSCARLSRVAAGGERPAREAKALQGRSYDSDPASGPSIYGWGRRCLTMPPAVEPEPVPLIRDAAGRLMVIGTRVPLDNLVSAFDGGDSPEAIHQSYPAVSLGDIYAIFTYCVRHPDEVNLSLAERAEQRAETRAEVEARFSPEGLRARRLARMNR